MAFKISLTPQARTDAFQAYEHIREVSPSSAEKWFRGLFEAIQSLEEMPLRCPLIPEASRIGTNARHLLYGKKSGIYRIIYDVQGDSPHGQLVRIVRIWHGSRDLVQSSDLD